jgi:hypothetical protein
MIDVQTYWNAVKAERAKLAGAVVFITSIANRYDPSSHGGMVSEASADHAARRIVGGSHRLSTPEEIETFRTEQMAREERCLIEEEKRKEKTVLKVSAEQLHQLIGSPVERQPRKPQAQVKEN